MICPSLRLESDGLDPLDLNQPGIMTTGLDLGDAVMREVVSTRAGADGTIDTSRFVGARVVTLSVDVNPAASPGGLTRWQLTERLRAFTHPAARPRLFVQFTPDDPEVMLTLRRSQFTDTWRPQRRANTESVVQWVCPDGIMESVVLNEAVARASASDATVIGRAYKKVYPWAYDAAPIVGSATVVNAGNTTVYPVLRLRGPMSDRIELTHIEQDRSIVIDGTTIPAGSYIEIDTRTHRITLNSDPDLSRRQFLVFPDTQWWTLDPGEQRIRLVADTFDSPAQVEILWHDAWY